MRKQTLGSEIFGPVIPKTIAQAEEPKKAGKERFTVQVPTGVIERVKNAVYWTHGLTLSAMAERAFAEYVDRLEAERGEPFPPRNGELPTGRPMK